MKKIVAVIMTAFVVTSCTVEVKSSTPAAPPASSASSSAPAPTPTEETKEPSPEPEKTEKPSPTTDTAAAREALFPTFIKKEIPTVQMLSDAQVVKFGKEVCGGLADGDVTTKLEMVAFARGYAKSLEGALTNEESYRFLGASIAAFCPDYEALIK